MDHHHRDHHHHHQNLNLTWLEPRFARNERGLAKVGGVTQNFSARSARTLLNEHPFLNSWIRPCIQLTLQYTYPN